MSKITFEIPDTTPALYVDFLKYLMKKHPVTHSDAKYSITMKHTNTVYGRPGHFFGSRPSSCNYAKVHIALGKPEKPHTAITVLHSIAHEYKHLLQHDQVPPVKHKGRERELEADLFALREVFLFTGDKMLAKLSIYECYKGTRNFLTANPEVKEGLFSLP